LPSFPLEVARVALGVERSDVTVLFGEGIRLGDRLVPADGAMRQVVSYRPPGRIPVHAAADVLTGALPRDAIAGKVVMVGADASGLRDSFVTPFDATMPGATRYAQIVENIVTEDFVLRRDSFALVDVAT